MRLLSTRSRIQAALLVFLITVASTHAATLKPPLQSLRDARITLISAELGDRATEDHAGRRMVVRIHECLRCEVSGTIELHVLPSDFEHIVKGQRYLMAYTDVERAPYKVRKEVRNPDRKILLHIDGASPAIFPDTAEVRRLLDPEHRHTEQEPAYLDTILRGLKADSPRLVDLWSAELIIGGHVRSGLDPSQIELVREVVVNSAQPGSARSRLLLAAFDQAPALGDWYASAALEVLRTETPARLRDNPELAELIRTALTVLQSTPSAEAALPLETWLRGPPALAEAAALALRVLDPELEVAAVERALQSSETPAATKRMLGGHLDRLNQASS